MRQLMLAMCLIGFAAGALAQSEAATGYDEVIVVTAEPFDRTLSETNRSVEVFKIDVGTEHRLEELLIRVPNVRFDPDAGGIIVREMPQAGLSGGTPTVIVMVDDVFDLYSLAPRSSVSLFDVSQVEVMRGAHVGTTYPAAAGAVVVQTNSPSFERSGRVTVDVTEDTRRQYGVAFGDVLKEDVLAYRVAAQLRTYDGDITNVAYGDKGWNDERRYFVRGKVLWQPAAFDDVRFTFGVQHIRDELGANSDLINRMLPALNCDPYRRLTDLRVPEFRDNAYDDLTLRVEHDWGDWNASYLLSYQHAQSQGVRDADGVDTTIERVIDSSDNRVGQIDLRFSRSGTWPSELALYGAFLDGDTDYHSTFYIPDLNTEQPITLVELAKVFGADEQQLGFIVSGFTTHTWPSSWRLDLGVRVGWGQTNSERPTWFVRETSSGDEGVDAIFDGIVDYLHLTQGRTDGGASGHGWYVLPQASLSYDVRPNVRVGVTVDRGYRYGGTDINVARSQAAPFREETSWNFDAFARSAWWQGRVAVDTNVFHTIYDDMQTRHCFSQQPFDCSLTNAGDGRADGMETSILIRPVAQLELWISAGVVRYDFDYYDDVEQTPTKEAYLGRASPWSVSGGLSWTSRSGIFVAIDTQYRELGGVETSYDGQISLMATTLVNARAGWRLGHSTISLFARNLTDERYLSLANPDLPTGRAQHAAVAPGREIGLTLDYSW